MRKLLMTTLGVAALATASMANAAVTIISSTGLDAPNPATSDVNSVNGVTSINFGTNPAPATFTNIGFTFSNDVAGLYSILISTTDRGITFTGGTLTGPGGVFNLSVGTNPLLGTSFIGLPQTQLAMGTFNLAFSGTNAVTGGSFAGTAIISPAGVPEPATWGMMLLGFGAMGVVIRRRRQPALPQLA